MENKDDLAKSIGHRLREIRKETDLTLKKLAEWTGLSPALLSRIENGLTMPSIPTLQAVANSLRVDIGYFFRDQEKTQYVISKQGSRRTALSERGYDIERLVEGMENHFMEPVITSLRGKDQEETVELVIHDGQEFMYVLEGKIEVTLGTKKYILKKGDAAYWNGSVPHKGISLSKRPARTLNTHLVPGKRTGTFGPNTTPNP